MYLQQAHAGENCPRLREVASASIPSAKACNALTVKCHSTLPWNGQHLLGPHSQRSSSRNIGELDAMYVCTRSSQRCLCHPISLPLRWEECGKAGGRLCWTTPQDNRRFCKIVVDSRANSRKHFLESSLKNRPVEFLSIPFDSWLVVVLQELHVSQKGLAARTSWTVIEGIDEQSST